MSSKIIGTCGLAAALALLAGYGAAAASDKKEVSSKTAESSITTNENGSVSRVFTESTVTTNGNLVTERRRETRTNMDESGNVLETSTSEYTQSYNVGDTGWKLPTGKSVPSAEKPLTTDRFLGLAFGSEFASTNFVQDTEEPALLCAPYKPPRPLPDFDDYFVYVTPKTHQVVKVCACAKQAIASNGGSWRRHHLIEALEKRYGTWARLCSFRLPYYAFDVAPDRYVTVCLAGAGEDYETVISAWDNNVARKAAEEYREQRIEARKKAAERRQQQVKELESLF